MSDWVDDYFDNYGWKYNNRAFDWIKVEDEEVMRKFEDIFKDVIRVCSKKEEKFNKENFEKLKVRVVNESFFNTINDLSGGPLDFKYFIFIARDCVADINKNDNLIKHKIAHELAHFLFALQGVTFDTLDKEQYACNQKADEWGFPKPKESLIYILAV